MYGYNGPFSSLFVGMRVATLRSVDSGATFADFFQFPFRRDARCNLHYEGLHFSGPCDTFSSLFVGMRVATGAKLSPNAIFPESFQFPFRRDARCNSQIASPTTMRGCSFSSLFVGMRVATRIPGIPIQ